MPQKITKSAVTTVAREFTKDPEWCVRHLFSPQLLPRESDYEAGIMATWEYQVSVKVSQLLNACEGELPYWVNAVNVCEDAKAGLIPPPSNVAEFLNAMVIDFQANVQGALLGRASAGKNFTTMPVAMAARQIISNMCLG